MIIRSALYSVRSPSPAAAIIFHNGIISTTSVQVPAGTLTADSIVADSLIIGTPSVKTRTWDGGGTDNKWSTAANWVGDVKPSPGDNLVFPVGAARLDNTNDYPLGTLFDSITVSGGSYHFHNGIVATTSVQVPSGTLTADCIVADTLIIGSSCGGRIQLLCRKSRDERPTQPLKCAIAYNDIRL